jgi:hypothetical protein
MDCSMILRGASLRICLPDMRVQQLLLLPHLLLVGDASKALHVELRRGSSRK